MLLALLACESQLDVGGKPPRDSGDTAPVDTADTADTAPPFDSVPDVVEYDCDALAASPLEDNELDGPRGYHDVIFDRAGYGLGFDGSSLVRSTYDGDTDVVLPRPGNLQQMDWLPDGDMVVGDDFAQDIKRITAAGASTVLAGGLGAVYGVVTGPDGRVYVVNGRSVYRVDPRTGDSTEWLRLSRGVQAHTIAFRPGDNHAYLGTIGSGTIYAAEFDDDYAPVGEATEYATVPGSGWHDGLGFDACGNLFVADYYTSGLYRVAPDGTVTTFYRGRQRQYGHGLEWGSGLGGWRADALYLPQPYDNNTVREVVIGVPSAWAVD